VTLPPEDCTNGIDDDGDTLIDGADSDCVTTTGAAAVVYTGAAAVQYSDPATLSATLSDTSSSPSTPVAGEQIDFVVGTQSTSAGPTDANGHASTPLTVTQQPGTVTTVETDFAGSSTHDPASDSDAFSVTKEDCTLTYTGDTLVAPKTSTLLKAQFGEPDTSPGTWTGKSVEFQLMDSGGVTTTHNAVTNASGVAQTTQPLPPNVYGVVVTFAGDDYYNQCASPAAPNDTLVTVQAQGAAVTGGGWVANSSRTNFGFNLMPPGSTWTGQFQLRGTNAKAIFHGNAVTGATKLSSTSYKWTGTGKWNGVAGHKFEATVVDNGTSRKSSGDTINVVVRNASNTIVYQTGTQTLKGGNITVR
jgi:hypothetical protein